MKLTLIVQDFCDSPIFWRESYMYSEWQIDELCTIIVNQTASSFTLKQKKCALKYKKLRHYFSVYSYSLFRSIRYILASISPNSYKVRVSASKNQV